MARGNWRGKYRTNEVGHIARACATCRHAPETHRGTDGACNGKGCSCGRFVAKQHVGAGEAVQQ